MDTWWSKINHKQTEIIHSLSEAYKCVRTILSNTNSTICFCHNDIQENNILNTPIGLKLIDYEYASYNFRAFDIGNHFCEWTYDYISQNENGFTACLENYPTLEQQTKF